ncbi:hypothetical protein Vretimale_15916 [Volvox reticuliferus]|uniref:Uncharacterized protein n=1 Tax=Volvox reticuliferus TaxID=1737510 RepID=A0A8J4FN25_9CHLO|nr:hypothetical protein Vretifemale_9774 [Volvox reticuliferus]GIM12741.1 hypothetical protein Vretimale_15916 [Volvox reticuliferus]
MEDGPKLLPQWLRGNSSALHHRGDTSDASKRGKPAGGGDTARSAVQADSWLPRPGSGPALNGVRSASPAKGPADFVRASDRVNLSDRSWKARDNGYSNTSSRSGYVPVGLKHSGGRDERDGIVLKPGGGFNAGRGYGRPSESDGGSNARVERGQESWQSARATSTGSRSGRRDEDSQSPARISGVTNGSSGTGASAPPQASFEADFPSLRPLPRSGSPGLVPQAGGTVSPATSAPLLGTSSSPVLDTASSTVPVPYRQNFLSSRTSSNWTSKLAEAPTAPSQSSDQRIPSAACAAEDVQAPPQAVCTLSPSPAPPAVAHTPIPVVVSASSLTVMQAPTPAAPVPVVPPRPSGVWGTTAMAAAMASVPDSAHTGAAVMGAPFVSRARLDNLAVRQSKQLVPVISSGGGKSKLGLGNMSGLGMAAGVSPGGAGIGVAGTRAAGGPKVVVPTGLLKMSAGKRDDSTVGPGPVAAGPRVLTSNTVILSKKASQPLDRPLALTRTTSVSSPAAALMFAGAAAGTTVAGSVIGAGNSVGESSCSANAAAQSTAAGRLDGLHGLSGGEFGNDGGNTEREQVELSCGAAAALTTEPGRQLFAATSASSPQPPHSDLFSATIPAHVPAIQQFQPEHPQLETHTQMPPLRVSSAPHPALQVPEEEEAFLRSLGWTAFDEEDGDGEDMGLTEEEIAAFRAQQQRQAAAAAAATVSTGSLAVTSAAPTAVPSVAAGRRSKPLIVAASYGSEPVSSSTDSDSECE